MSDDPPEEVPAKPKPLTTDELIDRGAEVIKFDPAAFKASGGYARLKPPPLLTATQFVWRNPDDIPPRKWLYGRHLIRGAVSALIASGGVGKSAWSIVQAVGMVAGRNLLFDNPEQRQSRVWLLNLEDPLVELERRILATARHYGIIADDVGDRLFVNAGLYPGLTMATATRGDVRIDRQMAGRLESEIRDKRIDVLTVDPFISSHQAPENDNQGIDLIVKEYARIADSTQCSIQLIHHTRKGGSAEVNVESSRGAKAMTDACRSVQVINLMTEEEGIRAGIKDSHRSYFYMKSDKSNFAPPSDAKHWFRIHDVKFDNARDGYAADGVGVVVPWQWPNPLDSLTANDLLRVQQAIHGKELRKSPQADDWVGHAVAIVLGLDSSDPTDKARIQEMLKIWFKNEALKIVVKEDSHRKKRPVVEVGKWNS